MSEFCWLIEAPGQMYLTARRLGGYNFDWTADPQAALRFFNKEQCDTAMMAIRQLQPGLFAFEKNLKNALAVEHGFVGR